MNAQHTPGPWKVEEIDSPNYYAEILAGDGIQNLVRICDIPSWPCATEEAQANARLIAASTDLLEALEQCESLLSFMPLRYIDKETGKPIEYSPDGALANARAAIAKAKGQS